jgi:predicted transcriptional regulator
MAFTYLESYNEHQKAIHSVYSSRLKVQILLALLEKQASLSELRDITGSTSQALIPKIRSLENQIFVQSKNYAYLLTPLGKIVADNVAGYVNIMAGIDQHREFWASHDLSGLPMECLVKIGDLQNSEVELDTQVDIMQVYSHFLKIVREGEYIHGISSIMSPGIAETVATRIVQGADVELIVNEDVILMLGKEPYIGQVKHLTKFPNFKVYLLRGALKIGITVTNEYLSLGLYKINSNVYDSSTDLFSRDPRAVAWGEEVFKYYRNKASLIDLKKALSLKNKRFSKNSPK